MKILYLFFLLFFSALSVNAQDYLINFSGTGSSTIVETVTVENLTQGKSITILGTEVLHLLSSVTANTPLLEYMDYPLIVYPNPSSGDLTIQFEVKKSGLVNVVLFDITGREINRVQQRVQNGFQSFKIEGLGNGVYTVQVLLEDQSFSKKVICNGKSTSKATITYNGFSGVEQGITTLKSANSEQSWQYDTGDRLKFQGTSSKYSTIVMDVPTLSKTLSFDFVECTDADGNNYPVVKIGNQLWMAENLKTTKYNDETSIPNETDNTNWMNLSTGAYCWYNNDRSNKSTYGALYNWFAVGTNKLAPTGWHVPNYADWFDLIESTGGDAVCGAKLKETSTKHWASPNTGATNEFGFTGLPSGIRLVSKQNSFSGDFSISTAFCYWWLSEINNSNIWANVNELGYEYPSIYRTSRDKQSGCSVRCIKNTPLIKFTSKSEKYTAINETTGLIVNQNNFYRSITQEEAQSLDFGYLPRYRFSIRESITCDFNGDGRLDLFGFCMRFELFPALGDLGRNPGKFFVISDFFSGNREMKIFETDFCAIGGSFRLNDINGDGKMEVIIFNSNAHQNVLYNINNPLIPVRIYTIDKNFNLTYKDVGEPLNMHSGTTGDVDNDGDIDIIQWPLNLGRGWEPENLRHPYVLINDGLGNFTTKPLLSNYNDFKSKFYDWSAAIYELFDLNNDGNLDILFGYNFGIVPHELNAENPAFDIANKKIGIMWGNGSGQFDYTNITFLTLDAFQDHWMCINGAGFTDFDNDGDVDVMIEATTLDFNYNNSSVLYLIENKGKNTFEDVTQTYVDGSFEIDNSHYTDFYQPMFIDKDGDGDFDMVPDKSNGAWQPFKVINNLYWEKLGKNFIRRELNN